MTLRTEYEFVLPRGYVDGLGDVHRRGTMRLATARDELEPLRDPMVEGPDDPRLTLLVLARVTETIGTIDYVTMHEIEGLFAADLAYLQDFYGVINFGTEADIAAMLEAQTEMGKQRSPLEAAPAPARAPEPPAVDVAPGETASQSIDRPLGRRAMIEEVGASGR